MHTPGRTNPFIDRKPLSGSGREAFLRRIRTALGHAPDASPPPGEAPPRDERLVRQVAAGDPGLLDRYVTFARSNSIQVERTNPEGVLAAIDKCLLNHKITRVMLNARDLEARFGLHAHVSAKGAQVHRWGEPESRAVVFTCDASITDCRAGLADTGAVLVWSDASFGRSSTLTVPVHIVLMPASRVLPDLVDGMNLVARENLGTPDGKMPSNVVVINGPSKTADIEMNLVTGVHGPKYLYVILIEGM